MRIGEVASRAGIPASTIRYYEGIGLIPPPPRRSGQRDYDESVFPLLRIIMTARQVGFSLEQIRDVLRDHEGGEALSASWRRAAEQRLYELEQAIRQQQAMHRALSQGMACQCESTLDCAALNTC